jgi:molecular chaperone GrpE
MKKLRRKISHSEIENTEAKLKVVEENWKRALADYQNLERRIEKQKHDYIIHANRNLIEKLLTILDDLEVAALHLKNDGLDSIINKLQELLSLEGVRVVEAEGKEFDPTTMECIERVEGKNNQVIRVEKKGYLFNDQILRPAKVEVGST